MIQKLLKKIQNRKAFTLVEMLIVLIIVALLMAIIIPNVAGQKTRIEKQARENIADIITTQVNTYSLVEKDETPTLNELLSSGYITQKQLDEAQKLLKLEGDATITLPIDTSDE